MSSKVAELNRVTKSYLSPVRVLDELSLSLVRGEFLYVVGGSGAGKSSLLRMLATEDRPTFGELRLFGFDVASASSSAYQAIRRLIGYIPQEIRLISDLTVRENVLLSVDLARARLAADPQFRLKVDQVLEQVGLASKRHQRADTLSGGEAQRVAFARALARSPELIVADEPTGAQDRDSTWSMMNLLVQANQGGATVVVATHDQEIVRRVRRRSAILQGGRIRLEEGALCTF